MTTHQQGAPVRYWDDELWEDVEEIRQLLEMASFLSDVGTVSALFRAEKKIQAAQQSKEAYTDEVRHVKDSMQKMVHNERISLLTEDLDKCTESLCEARESLASKYGCGSCAASNEKVNESKKEWYRKATQSVRFMSSSVVACNDLARQKEELKAIEEQVAHSEEGPGSCIVKKIRRRTIIPRPHRHRRKAVMPLSRSWAP